MATSRERLDQTLNHMEPEEVVVDMGSTPITGINANALDRLRKALGLEEKKVKINEPLQLLGEVEEDVRQKLHLDCVEISTGMNMFGFSNSGRKPWIMQSGLEVDVPLDFNTTVDEGGRTYLYPHQTQYYPGLCYQRKIHHWASYLTAARSDPPEDTDRYALPRQLLY